MMTNLEARLRLSLLMVELERIRGAMSDPEARIVQYAIGVLGLLRQPGAGAGNDNDSAPTSSVA